MLAAAALGALGAQLAEIRAAKEDWFVGAGRVDQEDVSLEADGAVTVRRQPPFDKALRNFPKMESPPKGKAERRLEVTDYETVMSGEPFPLPAPSAGHRFRRHDLACARRLTAVAPGCCRAQFSTTTAAVHCIGAVRWTKMAHASSAQEVELSRSTPPDL